MVVLTPKAQIYITENGFNKKKYYFFLKKVDFFSGWGVEPPSLIAEMSAKKSTFFTLSLRILTTIDLYQFSSHHIDIDRGGIIKAPA